MLAEPRVGPDVCIVKNPSDGFKVDGRDGFYTTFTTVRWWRSPNG